jgi:hypothetical protein
VSGVATVLLEGTSTLGGSGTVTVAYRDYADEPGYVLNGHERVSAQVLGWDNLIDWESDIVQTGVVRASKKTSPGGFHLDINAETNIFNANGTLTTTIDGVEYKQPANGA